MAELSLSLYVLLGLFIVIQSQEEQCINNPSYEYRSSYIHRNTAEALANSTYRNNILNVPRFQEEHVFIYHIVPKNGQDFILCTTPKSGHTRMSILLKRILSPDDRDVYGSIYNHKLFNPIERRTPEYIEQILNNASIPRYIVVRDPYVRAISMYTDKIQSKQSEYRTNIGLENDRKISFKSFVKGLYERMLYYKLQPNAEHIDRHFVPQSMHCGLDVGLTYNYILKQEEINDWFDCFIDQINARDAVAHGWPDENNCYLSTTKNPCNGPHIENGILQNVDSKTSRHHTGSQNLLEQYYSDRSVANMIAELYQVDIINFNYEFL